MIGRLRYLLILTATFIFFAWLIYKSSIGISGISQEAAAGKEVFQERSCIQCHSVFGNGGYYGGDLTRVFDRLGEEQLIERLVDPPLLGGASRKKHMSLSVADAAHIAHYLEYLRNLDTLGWPPLPQRK